MSGYRWWSSEPQNLFYLHVCVGGGDVRVLLSYSAYLALLRPYSWLCDQGLLLAGLGNHIRLLGSEP